MEKDGQSTTSEGSHLNRLEERYNLLFAEMASGSDRAAAVIGQALLEEAIKNSISFALIGNQSHKRKLIGDKESPGILGFSDQCRLAHGLGIVSKTVLSDLLIIGRIRNRFGHSAEVITFANKRIKDRCDALKTTVDHPGLDVLSERSGKLNITRNKYMRCVFAILTSIKDEHIRMLHRNLEEEFDHLCRRGLTPIALDLVNRSQGSPPSSGSRPKTPPTSPESE